MPCEKRKTRQVFRFRTSFRGTKPPFLYEKSKKSGILSYVFRKTYAISPQVHEFSPHEPQHFRRCFVSWLTSPPNFRTLYMPLCPFAQLCFLQDAINPFQKYKNSSFSLCNHLKYCIFVNNVHLSAMSPTKE